MLYFENVNKDCVYIIVVEILEMQWQNFRQEQVAMFFFRKDLNREENDIFYYSFTVRQLLSFFIFHNNP